MNNALLIGIIASSVFLVFMSFVLGYIFAKIILSKKEKKLLKQLNEVLDGKRDNYIEVEGVKYPAERFRTRDDKGNETLIDLKGGELADAEKNNKKQGRKLKNFQEKTHPIRENSRSSGKEKRIIRGRTRRRRIRRFG